MTEIENIFISETKEEFFSIFLILFRYKWDVKFPSGFNTIPLKIIKNKFLGRHFVWETSRWRILGIWP